jgi:hypothetical protein
MSIILDGTTGISSIGTLTGVTSISSAVANTPVVMQDSGSNTNTCRAWVNFNGTGTVAIRASFNVSSITDNGTGDYTVNFTVAMPDANYSCVLGGDESTAGSSVNKMGIRQGFPPTTTSIRVSDVGASFGDPIYAMVAIFR